GANQGKYLACWRKSRDGDWRVAAYVRTTPVPVADSLGLPELRDTEPAAAVRGRADQKELLRADSAFAAMSVTSGVKTAFLAIPRRLKTEQLGVETAAREQLVVRAVVHELPFL